MVRRFLKATLLSLRMSGGSPIRHDGWTSGGHQRSSDGTWTWKQGRDQGYSRGCGKVREEVGPTDPICQGSENQTKLNKAFGICLNLCFQDEEIKTQPQNFNGIKPQTLSIPA